MLSRSRRVTTVLAVVVCCCVLSFYRTTDAAGPKSQLPFANAVQQRIEMINHLRDIKQLLKEQNALLGSGNLKVVVTHQGPGTRDQGRGTRD